MRTRRRILNPRVLVPWAILLILALGIVAWLLLRDEPPPSEEGLREVRREVSDAENGFLLLDLEKAAIAWPEDPRDPEHAEDPDVAEGEDAEYEDPALDPSEDLDPAVARAWVEKHADLLAVLDRALALPDFQTPEVRSLGDPCEFLYSWRMLAYLVRARCLLHREAGREAEAFEDALRLVRFGERIEGAQGPLIHYLVGLAVRTMGTEQLDRCLRSTHLPPERVLAYIEELRRHPPRPDGLQAAYRVEYGVFARLLDDVAGPPLVNFPRIPLVHRLIYKRNQTKRFLGEYIRCALHAAARDVLLEEHLVDSPACGDVDPRAVPLTNYLGRRFFGLVLPLKAGFKERPKALLRARVLEALWALRRFETDRGRLPGRLEDLVPKYLDSAPVDPFGGGPLRYSAEQRIVYSVGQDLEDAGGGEGDEARDRRRNRVNEPTFRLIGDAPPTRG